MLTAKKGAIPTTSQLNRYAYVGGNPETFTDPTGHRYALPTGGDGGNTQTHGDTPPPAVNQGRCENDKLCHAIIHEFHDPKTRAALFLLTVYSTGLQFLPYLLAMGKKIGDDFIKWGDAPSGSNAYTWPGGAISVNDAGDAILDASYLIHEAVESYFAVVYHAHLQASREMDYVAEWFAGKFLSEAAAHANGDFTNNRIGNTPTYGSYGYSYQAWLTSPEGKIYLSEPKVQSDALISSFVPGPAVYATGGDRPFHVGILSNAPDIGLSLSMLFSDYVEPYDANPTIN